ncbi:MAG: hypothetical protein O7B99_11090 [Planctomycetota bacterium]|nr:hypothetical protein [Planctomycetota bacterium]
MHGSRLVSTACLLGALTCLTDAQEREPQQRVVLLRVPDEGIQPQVAVDGAGVVHLIYFRGAPKGGDVHYVRSEDGGTSFSAPLSVNSTAGSVVAVGTMRGAQLALGAEGRVHVAWMGSQRAAPVPGTDARPMLYARLNDEGTGFEPERNVIHEEIGLDGGGSIAADARGNVWVVWHAGESGEAERRVWVARSADGGATFGPEYAAGDEPTGACGCCGMRAFATGDDLFVLYRSATGMTKRDTILLRSSDGGRSFRGNRIDPWRVNRCPGSSFFLTSSPDGPLAAWQTKDDVYVGRVLPGKAAVSKAKSPRGRGARKHPVAAANAEGEVLLAWAEGTSWQQGGSIAWQLYDAKLMAVRGESGLREGLPVWSLLAVFARPDGSFGLIY